MFNEASAWEEKRRRNRKIDGIKLSAFLSETRNIDEEEEENKLAALFFLIGCHLNVHPGHPVARLWFWEGSVWLSMRGN